jgi:CDP-diacylglycerol---glycerol-3-phosphate 3-phosphatidyltransferase
MSDGDSATFGPDALATPANAITVARLLISPVFFAMVDDRPSWPALGAWFALCATDGVDGAIARRMGTTRSGAFLDPLADKVLVLGAMFALVSHSVFPLIPVLLIAARELIISVYRSMAARRGVTVPASRGGKAKTMAQQLAVALVLLPPLADETLTPGLVMLWIAVGLTVVTGVHYLVTAQARAREQGRA